QVARDPYLVRCAGCQVDIHAEQSAAGEVAVERQDVAGVAVGQADDAVVAQERARAHVEDAEARGLQATGILEQVESFAEVDQAVGQVDEPGIGLLLLANGLIDLGQGLVPYPYSARNRYRGGSVRWTG